MPKLTYAQEHAPPTASMDQVFFKRIMYISFPLELVYYPVLNR